MRFYFIYNLLLNIIAIVLFIFLCLYTGFEYFPSPWILVHPLFNWVLLSFKIKPMEVYIIDYLLSFVSLSLITITTKILFNYYKILAYPKEFFKFMEFEENFTIFLGKFISLIKNKVSKEEFVDKLKLLFLLTTLKYKYNFTKYKLEEWGHIFDRKIEDSKYNDKIITLKDKNISEISGPDIDYIIILCMGTRDVTYFNKLIARSQMKFKIWDDWFNVNTVRAKWFVDKYNLNQIENE